MTGIRKNLIKIAVCIIVFFTTLFLGINVYNQGNADMTAMMDKATLPLVSVQTEDITYNTLHGLTQDVNGSFFRDTITPLGEGRTLSFVLKKYGNEIKSLTFEVRSIDGSRLVESTKITNYAEDDEQIRATVTIKDLIEDYLEYNWILKVETAEKTVNYYTRIINAEDYHTLEKLTFVSEFHEKTFDKEAAKDLVSYLEPNSKSDNTTLSYVDIHCSLNQVTWGDLPVKQITDSQLTIREIEKQTASIRNDYRVQSSVDGDIKTYHVSEFYRIRYTADRMYLLDFERTMNQIFDPHADVYAANKIMLGIRDEEVQMMESDGGSNIAFVNEGQLFCYHAADKKLAYLFSFYDDTDERSIYDHYNIKILNVDETGNVSFLVYGYMNRGKHEGKIGIQVYEYNGMLNHIEEQVFIPYDKTYANLETDIGQLAYMNKSGVVYLYLDGSIIAVSLSEQSYSEIATQLQEGSFQVSDKEEMLVWQNSEEASDCTKLILMNLNTGVRKEITASGSTRLLPLGFINEDLIYGVAHYSDIAVDSSGAITIPMYAVYIQNESGEVLKSYEQSGVYVVSSTVTDNLITLKRVEKAANGEGYQAISDDQIVNNVVEDTGYNTVEKVATQNYEKIMQLVLKGSIETKNLKITEPKEVLYEGSRELVVNINSIDRFYVYSKDGIAGTFTKAADAINLAYSVNGTVIDEQGGYVWRKVSRSTRNQIMKITGTKSDEDTSELAVCVETILSFNGYAINVQKLLNQNQTVTEILANQLQDVHVLELQGVSLDAILYYVDRDIPVLAMLENDKAVLIVGFNELNIVVMDPADGTIYKKGMNDATEWLQNNGNQFVTYLPR